jgi:hypothetical protein
MKKAKNQSETTTHVEPSDLADVERGDVIVIDGTEYPVYRLNSGLRSLFTPDHPDVVTPNGDVKSLAYGAIREGDDETALAFVDKIIEKDESDFSPNDCLTVGLDNVEIHNGENVDILDQLQATSDRECPNCGNDSNPYQFGDRDGNHTREARRCGECDMHYVIDRTIPETTATVQSRSHDGTWGETVELSGMYREVVSSRFDLDPRQREREGYYSAKEVAQFINAKMNSSGETEQFGYTTARDGRRGGTVTWRDSRTNQKMEISFEPVRD